MLSLRISKLHWIRGGADDPLDQCAHGQFELRAEGVLFVDPSSGPWNLTMSGLYLLRTLDADHSPEHSVAEGNFLIPCCGHSPWLIGEGEYRLVCGGCNSGIDFEVVHSGDTVRLSSSARSAVVSLAAWRAAVLEFVSKVERFYARCTPKVEPGEEQLDRPGWAAFWQEWEARKVANAA